MTPPATLPTRTGRVTCNAPSAAAAVMACRDYATRQGMNVTDVTASLRAGADKPDDRVSVVVTSPAGPRSTYLVFITVVVA